MWKWLLGIGVVGGGIAWWASSRQSPSTSAPPAGDPWRRDLMRARTPQQTTDFAIYGVAGRAAEVAACVQQVLPAASYFDVQRSGSTEGMVFAAVPTVRNGLPASAYEAMKACLDARGIRASFAGNFFRPDGSLAGFRVGRRRR